MAKYRFFRTGFSGTFEIEIFKVGRRDGFVCTGAVDSFLTMKDKPNGGWYCNGTLREHKYEFPESREVKQSTARGYLRCCPVCLYERVMERRAVARKLAELKD